MESNVNFDEKLYRSGMVFTEYNLGVLDPDGQTTFFFDLRKGVAEMIEKLETGCDCQSDLKLEGNKIIGEFKNDFYDQSVSINAIKNMRATGHKYVQFTKSIVIWFKDGKPLMKVDEKTKNETKNWTKYHWKLAISGYTDIQNISF